MWIQCSQNRAVGERIPPWWKEGSGTKAWLRQHCWNDSRASRGRRVGQGAPCHTAAPPPSSTRRGACPSSFTGVQGTGEPTGCWGSPPKHVRSRWARTEHQPIWNIIYNNNNNNINNIRTSGSIFFRLPFGWRQSIRVTWQCISVSNLAPAQLPQWLRDRHFQGRIPAPGPGWPHRCPTTDSRNT